MLAGFNTSSAQSKFEPFKKAYINVEYDKTQSNDTITLKLWPNYFSRKKRNYIPARQYSTVIKNNKFRFEIDSLTESVYCTMLRKSDKLTPITLLNQQLCSPGDNIKIQILDKTNSGRKEVTAWGDTFCYNCYELKFSGRGSDKYKFLSILEKERGQLYKNYKVKTPSKPSLLEKFEFVFERQIRFGLEKELAILEKHKNKLPLAIYNLLKADIIGIHGKSLFDAINLAYQDVEKGLVFNKKNNFDSTYKAKMYEFDKLKITSLDAKIKSSYYSVMLLSRSGLENRMLYHQNPYDRIKNQYTGILREKLVTDYLVNNSNIARIDSLLNDALNFVVNKTYHAVLSSLLKRQQIGTMAYNFELPDSSGNLVKLSDFKGKLVFVDFWFTGCGGCSYYFKHSVSKAELFFKNNPNVVFITVSIDSSRERWIKGLKSGDYTSSDAINLYTNGQGSQHPIVKQFYVSGYPYPVLIGKNGEIMNNDSTELWAKGGDGLINTLTKSLIEK